MPSALARKYALQVCTYVAGQAASAATGWIPFYGINDLNNQVDPTLVSVADYDTNGWDSSEKTMQTWGVTVKARRPINANVYDAGQELVRGARVQFGDQARVNVRYFDRNGGSDAWAGTAIPNWTQGKTGVAEVEEIQVVFKGDGILSAITNPYQTALPPVVTAASPSGAGTGQSVAITGTAFTGATAVKFNAVAATSFSVINDGLIVAVLPTGGAGSAPIQVTGPIGTSNNLPYTRAA